MDGGGKTGDAVPQLHFLWLGFQVEHAETPHQQKTGYGSRNYKKLNKKISRLIFFKINF